MKLTTRIAALLLCCAELVSLLGCGRPEAAKQAQPPSAQQAEQTVREIETLAGGGYFEPVAREELSYADIGLGEITLADFEPYAQALTDAAETESREAFHRACFAARQMLTDMDTAGSLLDLESDRYAADEARGEKASGQIQAFYDAVELYNRTLHEIAAGEHAKMLKKEFADWQIAIFESYDEETSSQGLALTSRETQLVRQYAMLTAQDPVDYEAIADLYLELVSVRRQMAELAGAASFSEYAYSAYYSRDYTPSDAQKIWQTAKADFAPLLTKYSDSVTQALRESGVDRTLDCSEHAVLDALRYGAERMSPEVREACSYLLEHGLYDISYSEDKLSTGYTSYLYSYEVPFIFNCPYGTHNDYSDMFHEFGHWLAAYYHSSDPLYGVADFDLSELQSQGMEIMFLQFYDDIYAENAPLLRAEVLLNLVYGVVTGAMYDEFQQRVYAQESLTRDELLAIFAAVYEDYGFTPYDGYEYEWTNVIHNFQQPLYYISYAVSAIPALELYVDSLESPQDAMDTYLRVASMGDEDFYLTDALRETGLSNTMKSPISDVIAQRLDESCALSLN